MEILFLLIPLSVVLAFAIAGAFAWAIHSGQFDDLEQHGLLALDDAAISPVLDLPQASLPPTALPAAALDADQVAKRVPLAH